MMPHPRTGRLAAATALIGLGLSLHGVQALRGLQIAASPEAAWFLAPLVVFCLGAGLLIGSRRSRQDEQQPGRDPAGRRASGHLRRSVSLIVPAVWMAVDPFTVVRLVPMGAASATALLGPPLALTFVLLLVGDWLAQRMRADTGLPALWPGDALACLVTGALVGLVLGLTVILPSDLGCGGARLIASACLIAALAVDIISPRPLPASARERDPAAGLGVRCARGRSSVAGLSGPVIIGLLGGLIVGALRLDLLRPLRGNIMAWPLLDGIVLIGVLLGAVAATRLARGRPRLSVGPLGPALVALGAGLGCLASRVAASDGAFDDLLGRLAPLGWGGGDASFVAAALFPSIPLLAVGFAVGGTNASRGPEAGFFGAGGALLAASIGWIGGGWLVGSGFLGPSRIAMLVVVAGGGLALVGVLGPRARAIGPGTRLELLSRLMAGTVTVLAATSLWLALVGDHQDNRERRARLLGFLEAPVDPAGRTRLIISGSQVPAGPGAEERALLAQLVGTIHGDAPQRGLVIEPGPSAGAATLGGLGLGSIRVIDLVDISGAPSAGPRGEIEELAPGSFDLIVQEPVDPRLPESGPILTTEHFERLRERLADGGGVMVWLPLDRMRWATLGVVARSFRRAFGSLSLWVADPLSSEVVVGLFGRELAEPVSWDAIEGALSAPGGQVLRDRYDLRRPADLLARYIGDDYTIGDRFTGRATASDEHLRIETMELGRFESDTDTAFNNIPQLLDAKESFVGRLDFPGRTQAEARELEQRLGAAGVVLREAALASNLLARAERMRAAPVAGDETPEMVEERAVVRLWRALKGDPTNPAAHRVTVGVLGALTARGELAAAIELSEKLLAEIAPGDARYLNALAIALLAQGRDDGRAVDLLREAVAADGTQPAYQDNLGVALVFAGRGEEALEVLRQSRQHGGGRWPLSRGLLAYLEGDVETAARVLAPLVDRPPWGARIRPFVSR